MMLFYIIIGLIICIAALVGTISVGKMVNQTITAEQTNGHGTQVESLSSSTYEKKSLKNVRLLTAIYAVTFVVTIIILAVVLFRI